jgi:hypothetical protein
MILINTSVKKLVLKDVQLHQKMIAIYLTGGIIGLAIFSMPHSYGFYMGCLILMTVMIASGFHMINLTIINEKKEQTLAFIMSLPIRPIDYALGKLIANLLIFMVPWLMLTLGLAFVTFFGPISDGLLPFLLLISFQLVVNYVVVLSFSIITESEGWSIFFMVIVNLFLNPVIMLLARNPVFYEYFDKDEIVWSQEAGLIFSVQLVITLFALAAVMLLQARRRTFI